MELKALVTRQLAVSDEVIEIELEHVHSIELLKQKVLAACELADHRAHTQMRFLLEDTQLMGQLDDAERAGAVTAAEVLFPWQEKPAAWALAEHVKFRFTKALPAGEHMIVAAERVSSQKELLAVLDALWSTIDTRLLIANQREIACQDFCRTLPYEVKLKVAKVLGILYGQTSKVQVLNQLKQEAQEELESQAARVRMTVTEELLAGNGAPMRQGISNEEQHLAALRRAQDVPR